MITVLLAVTPVLAAPPAGFKEITTGNDCTVWRGPADAEGIAPVHAECSWPDVDPRKLHAALGDWAGHAKVHDTVLTSVVEKTEGGRSLVRQEHKLSGVSNREVAIWMEKKDVPGGAVYSWTHDAPVTPKKGNVATTKHVGSWTVTDREGGGADVVYTLAYNPGGSVPGFLIRWFQGSGTITTTEELRAVGR
jgi:hypothetical protein